MKGSFMYKNGYARYIDYNAVPGPNTTVTMDENNLLNEIKIVKRGKPIIIVYSAFGTKNETLIQDDDVQQQ